MIDFIGLETITIGFVEECKTRMMRSYHLLQLYLLLLLKVENAHIWDNLDQLGLM